MEYDAERNQFRLEPIDQILLHEQVDVHPETHASYLLGLVQDATERWRSIDFSDFPHGAQRNGALNRQRHNLGYLREQRILLEPFVFSRVHEEIEAFLDDLKDD